MPRIIFDVESGTNSLVYIMAEAEVNWSMQGTGNSPLLLPSEKETLRIHGDSLRFQDGSGGELSEVFFFLPAYLSLETEIAARAYYNLLIQAVGSGDWTVLEQSYSHELSTIREFFPGFLNPGQRPGVEWVEIVRALSGVFIEAGERFRTRIWPDIERELNEFTQKLPRLWPGVDLIGEWERHLGISFRASVYRIRPVYAMRNGPSANSLSFDTNTFAYWKDASCLDYYRSFISHEICTHMTLPILSPLIDDNLAYAAMENLARYLNGKWFGYNDYMNGADEFYHCDVFQRLYNELDRIHPHVSVKELFLQTLVRARRELAKAD